MHEIALTLEAFSPCLWI